MERITNSFEGGWNRDITKTARAANTYTRSINGRLIFNVDGTMSWENAKGTLNTVSGWDSNSFVVGARDLNEVIVVLSKSDALSYSEIGILICQPDGSSVYQKLFRDSTDDPDGNVLGFSELNLPQVVTFYESKDLYRVYWVDDLSEPRSYTFKKTGANTYEGVTPSVNGINLSPNWEMGYFNFVQQVQGSLKTGAYQYTYRMVTVDGYKTPWYPISTPVIVSANIPDKYTPSEYHLYDFDNADSSGSKANMLRLSDLDTGYDTIEVAAVYSIVSSGAKEATIFFVGNVDKTGADMYFKHTTIEGIPIELTEITDRKEFIFRAKTIQVKDNRLWVGNTESGVAGFDIPDDTLALLTVKPEIRCYNEDQQPAWTGTDAGEDGYPVYYDSSRLVSYVKNAYSYPSGLPLEGKKIVSETNKGGALYDYTSYKGAYMAHDRVGYFRDEQYRFGITFFDKKGNPLFTKHLADVEIPPQNATDYTNTTGSDPSTGLLGEPRSRMTARRVRNNGTIHTIPAFEESPDHYTALTGSNQIGNVALDLDKITGVLSSVATKNTELVYQKEDVSYLGKLFSDDEYVANREPENVAQSALRIVGLSFSGIEMNTPVPELGNEPLHKFIGGFSIVRVPREGDDEMVKQQGLMFQACHGEGEPIIRPFHGIANYWVDDAGIVINENNGVNPTNSQDPPKNSIFKEGKTDWQGWQGVRDDVAMHAEPHVYTFDSPDYMLRGVAPSPDGAGTMNFVASLEHGFERPTNPVYGNLFKPFRHAWIQKFSDSMSQYFFPDSIPNSWLNQTNPTLGTQTLYHKYRITHGIEAVGTFSMTTGSQGGFANGKDFEPDGGIGLGLSLRGLSDDSKFTPDHDDWNADGTGKKKEFLRCFHHPKGVVIKTNGSAPGYHTWAGQAIANKHFGANLFNYRVENASGQYGGATLEGLEANIYHTTNHFQPVTTKELNDISNGSQRQFDNIEIWGGDCYMQYFGYLRLYPRIVNDGDGCAPDQQPNNNQYKDHPDYASGICFPLESKYNLTLRRSTGDANGTPMWAHHGSRHANDWNTSGSLYQFQHDPTGNCDADLFHEKWELHSVVTYRDKVMPFVSKPSDFIKSYDHPTRWHWSNEKKPYGEVIDRFRQFEEISNFDLNAEYGEINGNGLLFNYMYSFQESGFGRLRIKDRAVLPSDLGSITLGEAGIMEGIDYVSKTYGTQHRDSIAYTDHNIYWADARMRKIIKFGQDGTDVISDSKGIHSFIAPYLEQVEELEQIAGDGGITSTIDYENNDVLFTIRRTLGNPEQEWAVFINETQTKSGIFRYELDVLTYYTSVDMGAEDLSALTVGDTVTWSFFDRDIGNTATQTFTITGLGSSSIEINDGGYFNGSNLLDGDPVEVTALFGIPTISKGGNLETTYSGANDPDGSKRSLTFSYNENIASFVSEYTFYPILYFHKGKHLYSVDNFAATQTYIWQHNIGERGNYYSTYYFSALLFVVNKFGASVKKFDSNYLSVNKDGVQILSTARYLTEEQTQLVNVSAESVNVQGGYAPSRRAKFRSGLYRFPTRGRNESKRLVGKYMETIYHVQNINDTKFSLTSVDSSVRFQNRV